MCLAIPGKIKSIDGNFAYVDIFGVKKKMNIQLIENPQVEDYILVHAGFGIQKIDMNYFNYLQDILKNEIDNGQST